MFILYNPHAGDLFGPRLSDAFSSSTSYILFMDLYERLTVIWQLFADAELGKDIFQHFVGGDGASAGDGAKMADDGA